jgi:hypothetical protein
MLLTNDYVPPKMVNFCLGGEGSDEINLLRCVYLLQVIILPFKLIVYHTYLVIVFMPF